jgi:hypothetical protein
VRGHDVTARGSDLLCEIVRDDHLAAPRSRPGYARDVRTSTESARLFEVELDHLSPGLGEFLARRIGHNGRSRRPHRHDAVDERLVGRVDEPDHSLRATIVWKGNDLVDGTELGPRSLFEGRVERVPDDEGARN